jgi:integrase
MGPTNIRADRPNAILRTREHLTPGEVEAMVEAAKANRWGHRDATMILLAFRHGFRAAELCDLRWDQVEFNATVLHVRRVKNGTPSTHPLLGDEMRAPAREHPITLCFRQRARLPIHDRRLCTDDRACRRQRGPRAQGASARPSTNMLVSTPRTGLRPNGGWGS